MAEIIPDFNTKEVENFCFNLQCIYKRKNDNGPLYVKTLEKFVQPANENFTTFRKKDVYESWRKTFVLFCSVSIKERLNIGAIYLKTLEKFVQPANENFTTFCKKDVYQSWRKLFAILLLKKLKALALICTLSIRRRPNNGPLYLKTLEKFVQPANENFTTFFKKHAYGLCRTLFPILVLKKLKTFAFICIVSIRRRLNSCSLYLKKLKNLFNPQMKRASQTLVVGHHSETLQIPLPFECL